MAAILAEIILILTACATLFFASMRQEIKPSCFANLAMLGLVIALGVGVVQGSMIDTTWHGHLHRDALTFGFSQIILVLVLGVVFFASPSIAKQQKKVGEYYALLLLSTVGMLALVKANSLLTLFLGLELMSLPLYAMVAMGRSVSVEAALKYFVLGALATGLLLYGFALLYGICGDFMYGKIAEVLIGSLTSQQVMLLSLACVFIVTGMAFKLGLAPFHAWVPDVYEGATTSTVLLLASAPKIASIAMMMRLFLDVMSVSMPHWAGLWLILGLFSIILGNLSGLMQTKWRRLLAYSSIGHMGFLSLALLIAPDVGAQAIVLYAVIYAMTTLLIFAVTLWLENQAMPCAEIKAFSGLNDRHPLIAFALLLGLLSLAGIPPIAGFMAKLSVIQALVGGGYFWVAITALLGAVVALYYYIRVIKYVYFVPSEEKGGHDVLESRSKLHGMVLFAPSLLMVILGLFPQLVQMLLF